MHANVQLLKKFLKKSFFFDDSFLWGAAPPQPPRCRRSALHPGDFLMRRKSPKTHQEPPGSWTSGEGGLAPFDPPALCPSGIGCGSLNPQTSSGASHLPRHGLTAGSVTPGKTREEKKTDLPTQLKVANRSFVVAESSPARDGAQRSEREKGGGHAPGDSKGRSPWRAFGDFPRDGKVTRGWRGGAPSPLRVEAKSGDLLRELCSHMGSAEGRSPSQRGPGATPCPPTRSTPQKYPKSPRGSAGGSCRPGLDFFHRIGYNILDQQSLKGRCGQ